MRPLLLLWLLAAACSSTPATPAPVWGPPFALGQAAQAHAPALWAEAGRITAAWTGANPGTVYFSARAITANGPTESATLALPARSPRDLRLLPARGDDLNLLWLDTDDNNGPRLFAGRFNPDLEIVGSYTQISDRPTYHYDAAPNGDDTAWIVWTGGSAAEPGLYAQRLNVGGRPLDAQFLTTDAAWPVLSRTGDGTVDLYWQQATDGRWLHGSLVDGQLQDTQTLNIRLNMEPGTILHGVQAGQDTSHRYLFWTITDSDGSTHSLYSSAPHDSADWSPLAPLTIAIDISRTLETGYNSGPAYYATAGSHSVAWAQPLAGLSDVLPVAGATAEGIAVVYMQAGQVIAARLIATTEPPGLIGYPALTIDRQSYLYLAWSQPHLDADADLKLTSLRFNWQAETPPGMR